jgi:hypothetical protein
MNVRGRDGYVRKKIACGDTVVVLATKPYRRQHHCNKWDCVACSASKISKLQDELKAAELAVTAYLIERPQALTETDMRPINNFLTRQVRGPYWLMRSDFRILIVTKLAFPGSVRRDKGLVIKKLIPEILKESWHGKHKKRITRRHGKTPPKPESNDKAYAQFLGENKDAAEAEFGSLKTDRQRADWLLQHQDETWLFIRGKQITKQYKAGER